MHSAVRISLVVACLVLAPTGFAQSPVHDVAPSHWRLGANTFPELIPACTAFIAAMDQASPKVYHDVVFSGVEPQRQATCRYHFVSNPETVGNATLYVEECPATFAPSTLHGHCHREIAPVCTVGEQVTAGYFPVGTSPSAHPAMVACVNNCQVAFDGIYPAGSEVVNGVRTYYARGSYDKTGTTCQSNANPAPPGSPGMPTPTCAAGTQLGSVNGQSACYPVGPEGGASGPSTGGGDPPGPGEPTPSTPTTGDGGATPESAPPSTTTTTSSGPVTQPNGDTTTTSTSTTTNPDGSTSTTTTTTTTRPDGSSSTTTTTRDTPPIPPDPTEEDPEEEEPGEEDPCETNSSGEGCGGEPAAAGASYTKKTKTMSDVLNGARNGLQSSQLGAAVSGFFNIAAAGTCPTWNLDIGFIGVSADFDYMCLPWAQLAVEMMGYCMLIVGAFLAFRVAVH